MANKIARWTKYLPNIQICLGIGPVRLNTVVMYESMDSATVEAFSIDWQFFKWNGRLRLYYKLLDY